MPLILTADESPGTASWAAVSADASYVAFSGSVVVADGTSSEIADLGPGTAQLANNVVLLTYAQGNGNGGAEPLSYSTSAFAPTSSLLLNISTGSNVTGDTTVNYAVLAPLFPV